MTFPDWLHQKVEVVKTDFAAAWHWALIVSVAIIEYTFGIIKRVAVTLMVGLLRYEFKKGKIMQPIVIAIGSMGQLTISESAGKATIKVSISQAAGGGNVSGFANFTLSAEGDVDLKVLIDAGFALLKAKFPSAGAIIDGAQAAVDAELAKI